MKVIYKPRAKDRLISQNLSKEPSDHARKVTSFDEVAITMSS